MEQAKKESVYGSVMLKAKDIMNFITDCDVPPRLIDISRNTDMNKGTVLKILRTLELCGYVRCQGQEKRYCLGTIFLKYAQTSLSNFDISEVAEPFMAKLRDETGETVNLGILENNMALLLQKLESPSSIQLISSIGKGLRLYTSAMGKAILSTFSDDELASYIEQTTLEKVAPNTITDRNSLLEDIKLTKERGYALEDRENQPDVVCVGFALVKNDKLFGALSISAPKYRVEQKDLEMFIQFGMVAQKNIINAL
ncbi:IclR family transcriptional regulator [Agrilactobacillus composti]|nr:IclR family transcriptional regulator [Agrilactobacillus composti]